MRRARFCSIAVPAEMTASAPAVQPETNVSLAPLSRSAMDTSPVTEFETVRTKRAGLTPWTDCFNSSA